KGGDFLRLWWKTCEVKIGPTDEGAFIGPGRWLEVFGLKFLQNEIINPGLSPALILNVRRGKSFDWLKSPVFLSFVANRLGFGQRARSGYAGIGCAHFYPCLQAGNLLGWQLFAFR